MKKSMKMVSVMMSAVMAMSAMSALAAGTYAEELPAEPAVTITETTETDTTETGDMGMETTGSSDSGYESDFDPSINHGSVPVTIKTDGINGRLRWMDVTIRYELTAKADSPEVRGIMYANPKTKKKNVGDGKVKLNVVEKRTINTDDEISFNIPANADMQKVSVEVWFQGSRAYYKLFKYYLADAHVNGAVSKMTIDLDATSWFFDYDVTGKVYVNNDLVYSKKR